VFKKIIVGVDFSENSQRAARTATQLARALDAEVVLVHVYSPGAEYEFIDAPRDAAHELRPLLESRLRGLAEAYVKSSGAKVDWGVVDGRPAQEVAVFAERWGGDLIVAGTAGRAGVTRALLGSVTDTLLREAKVPVLVVGPDAVLP